MLSTINDSATSPNLGSYTYALYQGTSMATPHVAGIASLMLSRSPALTPSQVLAMIQTTARAFPTNTTFRLHDRTLRCRHHRRGGSGDRGGWRTVDHDHGADELAQSGPRGRQRDLHRDGEPAVEPHRQRQLHRRWRHVDHRLQRGRAQRHRQRRTATCSTSSLTVGTHSIVASYSGDAANAASVSTALSQVITDAAGSSNVALASAGAVASASSTYSAAYPVTAVNNNERAGVNWGNGGGWTDATANAYPDWVQINFNGSKTIDRVVVYTVQDNYTNPIEPTDSLTFTLYGITDFTVQGWNGSPPGSRWPRSAATTWSSARVTFAAFTTDRIRVNVTNALAAYSRITEIEAWGNDGGGRQQRGAGQCRCGRLGLELPFRARIRPRRSTTTSAPGSTGADGGGWADATANAYPDWVQINFNGSKTINRVVVYTVQDNYANPVEPTDSADLHPVRHHRLHGAGLEWFGLGHLGTRQRQQPGQAHASPSPPSPPTASASTSPTRSPPTPASPRSRPGARRWPACCRPPPR